jgi:serine/threonine protein kinase
MSLLPPGSRLGRFELTSVLGQGAMGVVYLASDPNIERPVAIKTLRRDVGGGAAEELESRFLKEAKLAGRLQHPNIVTIYEAGRDKDNLFIAMEYVDGRPLTHSLGPRTTSRCRRSSTSPGRSPKRSRTLTSGGSCTETSSPGTSCFPATGA